MRSEWFAVLPVRRLFLFVLRTLCSFEILLNLPVLSANLELDKEAHRRQFQRLHRELGLTRFLKVIGSSDGQRYVCWRDYSS